jgi:hypothetical protein
MLYESTRTLDIRHIVSVNSIMFNIHIHSIKRPSLAS